jgi:hypothetical protein
VDRIHEWVDQSDGHIRADVVHEKLLAMGYGARNAWPGRRRSERPVAAFGRMVSTRRADLSRPRSLPRSMNALASSAFRSKAVHRRLLASACLLLPPISMRSAVALCITSSP